jgi:hypothetical protein
MTLDLASVLAQWAVGGLAFLWVTTRRREVSLGYGWLLRGVYGGLALLALLAELRSDETGAAHAVFVAGMAATVLAAAVALLVSVLRRGAGVSGHRAARARREARVAAMVEPGDGGAGAGVMEPGDGGAGAGGREFPPGLDLVAPAVGAVGLLGAAGVVGGAYALTAARLLVGAAFLGVVTDAMLLGHWYLTQPGLTREPLRELVKAAAIVWPLEVLVLCLPPGMLSVLAGDVGDGYGGLLGWMWVVCAFTTIGLIVVTWLALRERAYSAVMAATGLLYLAILTAFGTDLVARALLT